MSSKKILMIIILLVLVVGILLFLAIGGSKNEDTNISNTTNSFTSDVEEQSDSNLKLKTPYDIDENNVRKAIGTAEADESNIVNITDNYFIESTNDIYINLDDYVGKTIKIEGLIYKYDVENGEICYAVVRNTPGCCGNDGIAGLDIRYDGEYPEEDTWVEVIGVVEKDVVFNRDIPAIHISSITEKEKGKTFVAN